MAYTYNSYLLFGNGAESIHDEELLIKASVESQKGAITIQRCSVDNQKSAFVIDIIQR